MLELSHACVMEVMKEVIDSSLKEGIKLIV